MHFISTSGHGYLRITISQFKKAYRKGFRPSTCSYINNNSVLLEEDNDMIDYLKNYTARWSSRDKIHTLYQEDINRNLYSHTTRGSMIYAIECY